ncbi:hypothetical protein ACFYWU_26560 [Streptomyces chrestomyceticus]|uniref:hypothetical protein n=1 Tax=Streptomyces chrestomyceticus TaxID=68185 RepID=UPI00367E43ED
MTTEPEKTRTDSGPGPRCAVSVYRTAPQRPDAADGTFGLLIAVECLREPCRGLRVELPRATLQRTGSPVRTTVSADNWTVTQEETALVAGPAAGLTAAEPPVESVRLCLDGLGHGTDDPLKLTVTALVGDASSPASTTHHYHVADPSVEVAQIDYFLPDPTAVDRGGKATLTWRRTDPDETGYLLQRHTDQGTTEAYALVSQHLTRNGQKFTYKDQNVLTRNTAFTLTHTKGVDKVRAATLILVRDGDLTVGELTATGIVGLIKKPQSLTQLAVTDKTRFKAAPADGLLTVTLRENKNAPTATVVVDTPDVKDPLAAKLEAPKNRASVQLAVGKGARISFRNTKQSPQIDLVWFPIGLEGGHLVKESE